MLKRTSLLATVWFLTAVMSLSAADIEGFWKSVNEKTKKPESVVAVYKYQDKYYGRLIGTFDEHGKMIDDIYHPIDRAPGVEGNPYYSGLDIIWNLSPKNSRFKGKIMDPEKGKTYKAELWVENGKLIVRGEILFFGRNQTWPPAVKSDFPPGFKIPDTSSFVPIVHEVIR